MRMGEFCGISTPQWFWLAIAFPSRIRCLYGFAGVSNCMDDYWICSRETELSLVCLGVFTLGTLRVLSVFALALSNRDTLILDIAILRIFAIIVTIPALYLLYSVIRYFSFKRASGIDHFDETIVPGRLYERESSGLPAMACTLLHFSFSGYPLFGMRQLRRCAPRYSITFISGFIIFLLSFRI